MRRDDLRSSTRPPARRRAAQPRAHPRRGRAAARAVAVGDADRHRSGGRGRTLHAAPAFRRTATHLLAALRSGRRRPPWTARPARCRLAGSAGSDRSPSTPSRSSTSCRRLSCPSSWSRRLSASRRCPWRCTCSTSTARICCTWPARAARRPARGAAGDRAGTGRRRPVGAARAAHGLPERGDLRALAARARERRVDRLRPPRRAAHRAGAPGGRGDHAGRPLHRCVRAAQRRKQPTAAAEIQQSLLPPRIVRITGGEVAGNVLPSYEVAGDWFDVIENADGVWITPRRRPGQLDAGGREQRCGPRRAAGEPPQRRRHQPRRSS